MLATEQNNGRLVICGAKEALLDILPHADPSAVKDSFASVIWRSGTHNSTIRFTDDQIAFIRDTLIPLSEVTAAGKGMTTEARTVRTLLLKSILGESAGG